MIGNLARMIFLKIPSWHRGNCDHNLSPSSTSSLWLRTKYIWCRIILEGKMLILVSQLRMEAFLCYHQCIKAIHGNILHSTQMLPVVFICKVTTVIAACSTKNWNKFKLRESLESMKRKQTCVFITSVNISLYFNKSLSFSLKESCKRSLRKGFRKVKEDTEYLFSSYFMWMFLVTNVRIVVLLL